MHSISKKACTVAIALTTAVVLVFLTVFVTLAVTAGKAAGTGFISSRRDQDSYESRYRRLDEVYNYLLDEYYVEVDPETLLQGAIDGMLASLDDPFTFYYTPEEMSATNSSRNGNYVGIGVQVIRNDDNYIQITRVFSNGSAKEAGLIKNDIICSADGIELRPQNDAELTDAVAIIKDGEIGTFTELGILRNGEIFSVNVERRAVTQDRVEYEILEGGIGYLLLYDFFGSAIDGVDEALAYFDDNAVKGIIFDVRDNPGGSLDYCIRITDRFVDAGVIVYTEDRYGLRVNYDGTDGKVELPLVVLVNAQTASASEIFSAAIQEAGTGLIVGETTYGKGIVQTLHQFPSDGAGMQLTTSAYYTASGRSIHKLGVTPDVISEFDADAAREENRDTQLETALELLWRQTGYIHEQ